MNKDEKQIKVIKSQRLCGYLMWRGFVLAGMDVDKYSDTGRNVFFFNKTPELEEAVGDYLKIKNN